MLLEDINIKELNAILDVDLDKQEKETNDSRPLLVTTPIHQQQHPPEQKPQPVLESSLRNAVASDINEVAFYGKKLSQKLN